MSSEEWWYRYQPLRWSSATTNRFACSSSASVSAESVRSRTASQSGAIIRSSTDVRVETRRPSASAGRDAPSGDSPQRNGRRRRSSRRSADRARPGATAPRGTGRGPALSPAFSPRAFVVGHARARRRRGAARPRLSDSASSPGPISSSSPFARNLASGSVASPRPASTSCEPEGSRSASASIASSEPDRHTRCTSSRTSDDRARDRREGRPEARNRRRRQRVAAGGDSVEDVLVDRLDRVQRRGDVAQDARPGRCPDASSEHPGERAAIPRGPLHDHVVFLYPAGATTLTNKAVFPVRRREISSLRRSMPREAAALRAPTGRARTPRRHARGCSPPLAPGGWWSWLIDPLCDERNGNLVSSRLPMAPDRTTFSSVVMSLAPEQAMREQSPGSGDQPPREPAHANRRKSPFTTSAAPIPRESQTRSVAACVVSHD